MANRAKTILLYSDSGNSKTSQCVFIAKYIKKKYGKRTRLISSDGGGWAPVEDEGLIYHAKNNPEGCVEVFNMTNRKKLLADWRKLSLGWWPKIVKKIVEGEERMVRVIEPSDLSQIGAYFNEGLTSLSSGFLGHISKQDNTSDNTKVLFKAASYEEDGEYFGSTDKGHVGMVQNETHNLTQQFGTLPVELVVWTALVESAEEKITKNPIYGPRLAGRAKTPEAPSWFSDCFHIHAILKGDTDERTGISIQDKKLLAFFQRHKDEETDNVYLAKSSVGPSMYPKLKEKYPGGYVELGFDKGIVEYLEFVDGLKGEMNATAK